MGDDDGKGIGVIAVIFLVLLILIVAVSIGASIENFRLYKSCMVEMQDKPHKEAISICKERTKG